MDYTRAYASPLGSILMASDGAALTGLWFEGQKRFGRGLDATRAEEDLPVLEQAARWLDIYFSGRDPGFTPPVHARGTAFERAVWAKLAKIPFGQTAAYSDLARRLGLGRGAARAVGGAAGRNPVSLIIPCHRVVGANGLGGYAGGLARKRFLLALEGSPKAPSLRGLSPKATEGVITHQ